MASRIGSNAGGSGPGKAPVKAAKAGPVKRILNARPDTMDFRDLMYVQTLVEVPIARPLADYKKIKVPILDQGSEGACTGFGLATVANYLLRRRLVIPDKAPVSPRMFYENARRYDDWPGEDYDGSSARGAMKGWHKHGVCSEKDWPYPLSRQYPRGLTDARTSAARKRPLGAYYRVNHKDLVAMHSAIAEVGILYATSTVHTGWDKVGKDGMIKESAELTGGHAFAIVAYDEEGFWIQNSWGRGWGQGGFGRISYDDWLANGTDVWVARLGAPVVLRSASGTSQAHASSSGLSASYSFADLRPHIVSVGNDGKLKPGGDYGTTADELKRIFTDDMPRVMNPWPVKRVMLYAHGGLVSEGTAVQRLSEYRPALLASGVYPLSFIWHSDFWTTLTNIITDAIRRRRPEGFLDGTKDFLLDRTDDMLEPLARTLTGRLQWKEMKENALMASDQGGAAWQVAQYLADLAKQFPSMEIHVVGHSAGSIFHAPLLQLLTQTRKLSIKTCTLWAPACTVDLFKTNYLPLIQSQQIEKFACFVLNDKTEQDDNCANIYNKSLLYLVSNAFEDKQKPPFSRDGTPLLGMQKFIEKDPALDALFDGGGAELVLSPNNQPPESTRASLASHHGDFDDDAATVQSTFARFLLPAASKAAATKPGKAVRAIAARKAFAGAPAGAVAQPGTAPAIRFLSSESSLRERRTNIDQQSRSRT